MVSVLRRRVVAGLFLILFTTFARAGEATVCFLEHLKLDHHERVVPARLRESIGMDEIRALHQELAENNEIQFCRVQDGCLARAHAVSWLLEERGIDSRKIFAMSTNLNNFKVATDASKSNFVRGWQYHVATTVEVETSTGRRTMVLDPALFDEPATLEEWKEKMIEFSANTHPQFRLTSRFVYMPTQIETPPTTWLPRDLKWMVVNFKGSYSKRDQYADVRKLYSQTSRLYKSDPEFQLAIHDPEFNRWWYSDTLKANAPERAAWREKWKSFHLR